MGPDATLRPPAAPLPSRQFAKARGPARQGLLSKHGWTVGGLLLAQAMVLVFYLVLVHHVAHAKLKRTIEEREARERHSCDLIRLRLMRDQCFATLSTSTPTEVLVVGLKQAD